MDATVRKLLEKVMSGKSAHVVISEDEDQTAADLGGDASVSANCDDVWDDPSDVDADLDYGDDDPDEDPDQEDEEGVDVQAALDSTKQGDNVVTVTEDDVPDVSGDVADADKENQDRQAVKDKIDAAVTSIMGGADVSGATDSLLKALDVDAPSKDVEKDTEEKGVDPGVVGTKVDADTTGE